MSRIENSLTSEFGILAFLYPIVKAKLADFQLHTQQNISPPNGPLADKKLTFIG